MHKKTSSIYNNVFIIIVLLLYYQALFNYFGNKDLNYFMFSNLEKINLINYFKLRD